MMRTKCEIEQQGGNKSVLTSKSDQHVASRSQLGGHFFFVSGVCADLKM